MKHDFLFELLTEELPPKALPTLEQVFVEHVHEELKTAGLSHGGITSFVTPRRLAIHISQLENKQADQTISRRGPAIQAAYDNEGNPTKAALGFAQSCGIDFKEVKTIKTEKGEWLHHEAVESGKSVDQLLPSIIQIALNKLPTPKLMQWGNGTFEFIRPVHGAVMMYGDRVIPATFFGCETRSKTSGHRFHHPELIEVTPNTYENALKKAYVIAKSVDRKTFIKQQVLDAAKQHDAIAIIPEELLDEVASIVEWPVALIGHFPKAFLSVPKEALILSMQSNQKYFALTDHQGNLLPHFVLISNIQSKDPSQVIHGNEKVTQARLSDAKFFFETDQKQTLSQRLEQLSTIIFQKQLGTLQDKTTRVKALAKIIADRVNANVELCTRAAELSKADLLTSMVGEFPELQGVMGRYYAMYNGEDTDVAIALDEQYMPRFSGDALPSNLIGQVLGLAERLDTLVGIFGINQIPTGDKDPFALRRNALGILRILIEKKLNLDLRWLIQQAAHGYEKIITNKDTEEQALSFCLERLKFWARSQGIRPDVFDAVAAKNISTPLDFKKRLDAVNSFLQLPQAENLAMANKRVNNILTKQVAEAKQAALHKNLLQEPSEIALAEAIEKKKVAVSSLDYDAILKELAELNQPIDDFFTNVMIMTEDEKIRLNRLALLKELHALLSQVADLALLQGS